ncbi:MAG: SIR2 family NAD-dependent protein deacylase [Rudaea sp.]
MEIADELVQELRRARRVAVLTGAGVSAESGVPTFRDVETGLWAQYDPEELATREGFRRNPRLVWEWYASRRETIARVQPNPGHVALAEMERRLPDFTLITQNVDGLHARAGSRHILELHGNISRTKCFREGVIVEKWDDGSVPPRCPRCGSYLRPDVVWFGEALPHAALHEAIDAAESCDIFFSVGTSTEVEPAASLPFEALSHGKPVVEVNPEVTSLSSRATFRLSGPSGVYLPLLVQRVWGRGAPA